MLHPLALQNHSGCAHKKGICRFLAPPSVPVRTGAWVSGALFSVPEADVGSGTTAKGSVMRSSAGSGTRLDSGTSGGRFELQFSASSNALSVDRYENA